MKTCAPGLALMLACSFGACAPVVDVEPEQDTLMQISREWSETVATGDLEQIMSYWADDAVMMPPASPPIVGKAAIREFVEGALQIPGFAVSWNPQSAHIAPGGDMAYLIETQSTTMPDADGNLITTPGKAVTVWRKDAAGTWKNVIDMWNDVPPTGN